MSEYLSVFRNSEGEKLVLEAYDGLLTQWGIPYEEIFVDTTAGATHVIVSGQPDSPPLLLVHAFYASAVSWYRNVKALSASYRVYAIDIIGDPNKSKPVKLIRQASDFIEWFRQVLDKLKIDRCNFIGNSVGGFHVANFALNEPLRVKSMILIGPAAVFLPIPKFYINTFPGGMTGVGFLVSHAVKWIENGSGFDPGFKTLFYRLLKYGKATNQVFPFVMTDDQLKQIQMPVLLLYGEKEVIYDYSLAIRRAQQNIKNVKVEVIPGANHITGASRPDLTNEAILKFLKAV